MPYDPNKHHRRSIRLPGYDYTRPGAYFITICTHGRAALFGAIDGAAIALNDAGRMVEYWWAELGHKFPTIAIDAFVVMPDHIHGIIVIGAGDDDMRLNADASGNKLAFCNTTPTECRLATSLNNRGIAGTNQEWLVWKGFYGRIFIPYLTLDASSATYTNDGGGTTTVQAARFGFGGTANKILVQNLTISNMAVERDNLLTAVGTRGYAATNEDGFLGLRINGSIAIEGSLKMFACNSDHPRC